MNKYTWILIVILVVVLIVFVAMLPSKPGKYDSFAQCVGESGATFFGAFWCPHCQEQKALFGKSAKLLPYVECSTPDAKGQLAVCADKGITTYPTWDFADGERITGTIPLEQLSEKTQCPLVSSN